MMTDGGAVTGKGAAVDEAEGAWERPWRYCGTIQVTIRQRGRLTPCVCNDEPVAPLATPPEAD
jgi:hypothetical protein